MTVPTAIRDRLADIRGRTRDLRDAIKAAKDERDAARAAMTETGKVDPNSTEFKRAEQAVRTLNGLEDQLALVQDEERYVLAQLAGVDPSANGDSFLRDPEVLQSLAGMANSSAPVGRVNLGLAVPREDLVTQIGAAIVAQTPGQLNIEDGGVLRRGPSRGVWEQPRRPLRLLDLIPSTTMEGRSFEYSRDIAETPYEGAAETAEGAVKPAITEEFEDEEAIAKTIANFVKAKKQQLADAPILETIIRNRLAYRVLRRLENQIVSGNGVGENLTGILNTAGIASIAFDADELAADQALEGIVAVLLSEAVPNFVALNPRDWADMLKAKAEGDGHYFSGGPFVSTAERLWNVATVPSTGVDPGKALIGDTTIGATVFVREGVNVTASDADQDDFTRNRVTLLGEGRFALAIWQPSAFAEVEFTGPVT